MPGMENNRIERDTAWDKEGKLVPVSCVTLETMHLRAEAS
jgi:hypothetical protein